MHQIHSKVWERKEVLRYIYSDYYKKIENSCFNGLVLEVGSGIGKLSIKDCKIIKIDILYSEDIDITCDAHKLPFRSAVFDNIVLFDVFHHLESPLYFLKEARRVLKPNGRIIFLEPGISPLSWIFYNFFHQEEVNFNYSFSKDYKLNSEKDPYDSNQAIPTILFEKQKYLIDELGFSLIQKKWISLFAYPLSGGFKEWSLINKKVAIFLLKLENFLEPFLGKLIGFRIFCVLEKNSEFDQR